MANNPQITIYDDEELAGILVLLLRNSLDGASTFPDFQHQIDAYNNLAQALPDGDLFRRSIIAFSKFYALGAAQKTLVDNAHIALSNLFNGIVAAEAQGAVDWGECSYITSAQVGRVAGLDLSQAPANAKAPAAFRRASSDTK